ncbi:MAG TPA: hypothetical protein VEG30_02525 [Terriglobales bacterium]|nr:hypothetical protein [Terriglobales bacterium]
MPKAMFAVLLVITLLAGTSLIWAQGISDVYWVNYYSNRPTTTVVRADAVILDQTVRIINPGEQGSPIAAGHGAVCADIYVFNDDQEMEECCECLITANGLLTLSVNNDLTHNPLTGFPPPANGVIKIISDNRSNCDATSPVPTPDIRAWGTHLQAPSVEALVTTEDEFLNAPLQQDELSFLGQACSFVLFLGSGKGRCTCGASLEPA